jgi:hypothetical protein
MSKPGTVSGALELVDRVRDLGGHFVDHAAERRELRPLAAHPLLERRALDRVAQALGEGADDVAVLNADVALGEVAVRVHEADDHVLRHERRGDIGAGPRGLHERLEPARIALGFRDEHRLARRDHLGLDDVVVDAHRRRLPDRRELSGPGGIAGEVHTVRDHLVALEAEEHGAVEAAVVGQRAGRALVQVLQRPRGAQGGEGSADGGVIGHGRDRTARPHNPRTPWRVNAVPRRGH